MSEPAKPKRLVIIDGKSVFYRGYYAMPNLSTKDGTPTGGVYGFAVMALEIVKRLNPDYVCVAWDKAKTNIRLRREWYPEYKAGRKPAPPDFYEQIPLLHELLEALGWPLYEADDYEADDLMGAFAKQAGAEGVESYLVTSDLDVLQLVNSHTHIYTLKKGLTNIELFNEASFREKYGIEAHQWVDTKALKGDGSDNVPGVAGVGEKTALDLIAKYQTLDGVYAHLDDLKPALRAKLEKDKDMAYLSQKLVTLMVDAPVQLELDKCARQNGFTPELAAMLRKLEFRNLLRQVEAQLSVGEVAAVEAETDGPTLQPAKVVNFSAKAFKSGAPRVVALEPGGQELWLSPAPGQVMTVNFSLLDQGVIDSLANGPVVGHDLRLVFHMVLAADCTWPGKVGHDTRLGAFMLNSLQRSLELEDLLDRAIDLASPGETAAAIWHLYDGQRLALEQLPELAKLAREVDFPTINLLAQIEHQGIQLDSDYLLRMGVDFAHEIEDIEQQIYSQAGKQFNIGSPVQLAAILFDELQLPTFSIKKGKTGYSTGAAELAKLRPLHPIIDLVTKWREYTKLKSTYIDALPKLIDDHGRLHTTYRQDVAATGRLSSQNPNLQNIPTRTELGRAIRTAFVPAPGHVFVGADYSQFELRLAAELANDQPLIEDFNRDLDVHTTTAAEVYGVPLEQVTKDMRRHAKVVNFGILYGMSPHGLSIATGMTVNDAKDFIQKYFELRAPVRRYIDATLQQALKDGYVETLLGRRRPTPDLKSSNFVVREAAKRAAANMPIQGTEADLMKLAMLRVEERLSSRGRQVLQIHDSILVECPAADAEKVGEFLKQTMETIYPTLKVKLKVDITTGQNWGEL